MSNDGMMVFDVELSDRESFLIGRIIALWGALEHEVFVQTLKTFNLEAGKASELPREMNNLQFTSVLALWKARVVDVAEGDRREILQELHDGICHYKDFRQAIVHGMWDWSMSDLGRISSIRIRHRQLITVHFTADDLQSFMMDLQKINFRIRHPGGMEEFANAFTQQGFLISRRAAAMFTKHPVMDELLPPEFQAGKASELGEGSPDEEAAPS
jgi:hypothetical protein